MFSGLFRFAVFIFIIWFLGLFVFAHHLEEATPLADTPTTDAIIVLTGGAQRLEAGWTLFKAHKAKKLFISGVNEKVRPEELQEQSGLSWKQMACCVFLGYEAKTTYDNALEVQRWVADQKIRTVLLVTSNYHMPRSLLEMNMALRDVTIIPYPVVTPQVDKKYWWQRVGTRQLLVVEYNKFLLTSIRYLVTCFI